MQLCLFVLSESFPDEPKASAITARSVPRVQEDQAERARGCGQKRHRRRNLLREDLRYIKEHMTDIDMILTAKEEIILEEAMGEFERGDTVKLEDLKRGE